MEASENGLDWYTQRVSDNWYNASLFNDDEKVKGKDGITYNYPAGKAMPAIAELKNFAPSTGIETSQRSSFNVQRDSWYTLDGRRIEISNLKAQSSKLQKGIYIHNGKKAIVR